LLHREEAEQFYRELREQGLKARVGMESSGHSRWFERLLRELQFELWIGDAAEIRTQRVRKQKTDRQDAQLLLRLMMEHRFPRIWVPDAANRDLRQLLWHRHRLGPFHPLTRTGATGTLISEMVMFQQLVFPFAL
jgi:transposase